MNTGEMVRKGSKRATKYVLAIVGFASVSGVSLPTKVNIEHTHTTEDFSARIIMIALGKWHMASPFVLKP